MLTLVTKGSGTIITNGEETAVHAGDIYLSFPCDVHEIRADKATRLEYDFFAFTCVNKSLAKDLKNITQNHRGGDKRIFQDDSVSRLVGLAISEFVSEAQPHSQSALSDLFQLILVYLIRNFNHIQQNATAVSDPEVLCFQLMNYIDTHIYTIKKLEELAPKFNYSYGYLSTLFQRTTGKTLSAYHQNRKMETGKALISENKKSISEIAEMLGYSLYSFSKAFKKVYGISPKAMQKPKP
ncbi:MAG: helix-turn-helix transcriptional regulator [Clostridia bacterium]|nr:helix-turn-helix transcriptional regulator [Clostridia bacterium]